MTTYYNINPRFYVSVDCIIFGFDKGSLKLLLLKRNFEPAKGSWSLMGGFVQDGESVDDAAKRVLAELTGLENKWWNFVDFRPMRIMLLYQIPVIFIDVD